MMGTWIPLNPQNSVQVREIQVSGWVAHLSRFRACYMSCLCWLTPCLTCVLQAQDWRTDGSCWRTRAGDPQGQIHHNQPPPAIIFQKSRKWLKSFFLESSRNHRSNGFCRADAAEAGSREPPQLTNLRKICFCYFFTQCVATLKLPLSYTLVMNSFPPILRRMSPEFLPGPWTVLVDANHKALMQCIYSNHKGPSLCHFQATKDLLVKSIVNTFNNLQYHRPPM